MKKAPDPGSTTLCATYCIVFILQGSDPLRECRAHRRGREQETEEAEGGGHQQGRRQEVEIDTPEDENLSFFAAHGSNHFFSFRNICPRAPFFLFLYSRFLYSQKSPVFIKHCPPPETGDLGLVFWKVE